MQKIGFIITFTAMKQFKTIVASVLSLIVMPYVSAQSASQHLDPGCGVVESADVIRSGGQQRQGEEALFSESVLCGADRTEQYLHLLEGRRVGLLTNHSGLCGGVHLVDTLSRLGVDIRYIFAPEHGFRGVVSAGERVRDGRDPKTGIPVLSLYGASKAPADSVMRKLDVVVFDLQDVGLRYYTYLSTLHYLLEAAARTSTEVVILDRPNPNGHYVDGPILDMKHRSFVGVYPIPVVHGMTLGELAYMAVGEGWVKDGWKCRLRVIRAKGYDHRTLYAPPVPPSPNLPDMTAIYLYPSLCYFEATPVSVGRGTDKPFKIYGHPSMKGRAYSFVPRAMKSAVNPPCKDKVCHGVSLDTIPVGSLVGKGLSLEYVIDAYRDMGMGDRFFNNAFERLIGVDYVREMIGKGASAQEIEACWQDDVAQFKKARAQYLLYDE